jgi:hypothetical protein
MRLLGQGHDREISGGGSAVNWPKGQAMDDHGGSNNLSRPAHRKDRTRLPGSGMSDQKAAESEKTTWLRTMDDPSASDRLGRR